ncbi:MAG: hypothetical protein KME08_17280 [Aphanothece sp. CMT-3BRIN-NPC111]|jgi:hypothetical protein|nr:hypothetical protein [Aphanothece sp. CMT-3BRIN-NPC111]
MAASDDFKEQLKAGKIVEALALALGEAVELKITTWVSSESAEDTSASDSGQDLAKAGQRLRTRINLIDGDIDNEIGNQFLNSGPYTELRQFHLEQVAQSHKIIQNNLNSLQKLFEIWVTIQPPNPDTPSVEPQLHEVESQILPPVQKATAISETPQESTVEALFPSSIPVSEAIADVDASQLRQTPPPISFPLPESRLPNLERSHLATPENRAELLGKQMQPFPRAQASSQEALPLETQEDWGDLFEEETQPFSSAQAHTEEGADLEEEEWDDWVVEEPDSFAAAQVNNLEALQLLTEEDWEEFVPEELEPYPAILDPNDSIEEPNNSFTGNTDLIENVEPDSLAEINLLEKNDRLNNQQQGG